MKNKKNDNEIRLILFADKVAELEIENKKLRELNEIALKREELLFDLMQKDEYMTEALKEIERIVDKFNLSADCSTCINSMGFDKKIKEAIKFGFTRGIFDYDYTNEIKHYQEEVKSKIIDLKDRLEKIDIDMLYLSNYVQSGIFYNCVKYLRPTHPTESEG